MGPCWDLEVKLESWEKVSTKWEPGTVKERGETSLLDSLPCSAQSGVLRLMGCPGIASRAFNLRGVGCTDLKRFSPIFSLGYAPPPPLPEARGHHIVLREDLASSCLSDSLH